MRKLLYAASIACILFTTISSCKKDKKTTTSTPPSGALQLRSNVYVIDSTQWILFVNSVHPANGVYMYTFTPNSPSVSPLKQGDIIIGAANGGYVRRVISVAVVGSYYELTTGPATMADVFKSGSFTLQIPINDPGQSTPGVTRTYSNFRLYHNSNFSLTLLNGQFDIQPTCNLNFSFDSTAGLTDFEMSTTNTSANDNLTFNFKGVSPLTYVADTVLGAFATNSIQFVQAWTPTGNVSVPVVAKLNVSLEAKVSGGGGSDTTNITLNWLTNDVFTGGLQYHGGAWQALHSSVATNVVAFDTLSSAYHSAANLTFYTHINSSFYGVGGPQITTGLAGFFEQLQPGGSAPFHHLTTAWSVGSDAQLVTPVFGKNMGGITQSWTSDSVLYKAPYQLTKISGDNQTANVVSTLPQPLIVKITDSNGQPVVNVAVKFTVTNGGGTLSAYNLLTDQGGLVQVNWTLGIPMGNQNVTVTASDGFNRALSGAPAVFNATGD